VEGKHFEKNWGKGKDLGLDRGTRANGKQKSWGEGSKQLTLQLRHKEEVSTGAAEMVGGDKKKGKRVNVATGKKKC